MMGKRISTEEPVLKCEPTHAPQSTDKKAARAELASSPPSPSLSDMEHDFEMEIELGSQSPPGRSPPLVPSPGEDGPLVPAPPIITPPRNDDRPAMQDQQAMAPVLSAIRKRNVGRLYDGSEGINRQPHGALSPDDPYRVLSDLSGEVLRRMTNECFKKTLIDSQDHRQALAAPSISTRLPSSPSKLKPKGKLGPKATARKAAALVNEEKQKQAKAELGTITRFLPPNKDEAFIGFMPDSAEATIALAQLQCPSLSSVPTAELSIALHFDGSPTWVENVLFRVMPDTWPAAVTGQLPLIHIKHTQPVSVAKPSAPQDTASAGKADNEDLMGAFDIERNNSTWKSQGGFPGDGSRLGQVLEGGEKAKDEEKTEAKTWDQLVNEGALLGIRDEDFSSRLTDFGIY